MPEEREHIFHYLLANQDKYRLLSVPAPEDIARPDLSFDVETREDLERLRKLEAHITDGPRSIIAKADRRGENYDFVNHYADSDYGKKTT